MYRSCRIPSGLLSAALALLWSVGANALTGQRPEKYPLDTNAVFELDSSAVVTARKHTNGMEGDLTKGLNIDKSALTSFPKVLGTADPLKFVQTLPGVTTNSDWECGLRVQGCEASQSVTTLCETPVYGQGRILGLFSVFNPGHFSGMTFSTNSQLRRIGGQLDMETADTLSRGFHGEANLGPVSTHAAFAFPLGKKTALTVSGRRSFIDLFYKGLIKVEDTDMNYIFYDVNASFIYKIGKNDCLDVNGYYGWDRGYMDEGKASYYIGATWWNAVGNVRWRHRGDELKMDTQLYASTYYMDGGLGITQNSGTAQSNIIDVGLQSRADWRKWTFGAELNWYNIQPQNIYDGSSTAPGGSTIPRTQSLLFTLRALRALKAGNWTFKPSLAGSVYCDLSGGRTYPRLDPEVGVEYNMYKGGKLNLDIGYRHQYVFMTGLTNSGFPVEFWLGSGQYSDPQASLYATLSYGVNLWRDAVTVNVQAYGKRLWNMVEYVGFATDIIGGNYDLGKMLEGVSGYNWGASVQVQKNSGAFTGWISYSWGRALRRFDRASYTGGYFPSSHERIHELNAVASYKLGRWDFGGNFIFASGMPYTPVTAVYYINGTMMVKYGDYNSGRLSPYIRLDLSVSFNIRTKGRYRDGVNVSVQNVTARKNQMMATLKVKDDTYCYAPTTMIIPVLPSINYYCNF